MCSDFIDGTSVRLRSRLVKNAVEWYFLIFLYVMYGTVFYYSVHSCLFVWLYPVLGCT